MLSFACELFVISDESKRCSFMLLSSADQNFCRRACRPMYWISLLKKCSHNLHAMLICSSLIFVCGSYFCSDCRGLRIRDKCSCKHAIEYLDILSALALWAIFGAGNHFFVTYLLAGLQSRGPTMARGAILLLACCILAAGCAEAGRLGAKRSVLQTINNNNNNNNNGVWLSICLLRVGLTRVVGPVSDFQLSAARKLNKELCD